MIVTSELTADEYVRSVKLVRRKRGPLGPLRIFASFFYQGIGWLALALVCYRVFYGHVDSSLYAVAGLGVWFVFSVPLRRWVSKRDFAKNRAFHEPLTYRIDDGGLCLMSAVEQKHTAAWKVFSGFAEDDAVFVIFHRGRSGFVPISKAHIPAEDVVKLREQFRQHLRQR